MTRINRRRLLQTTAAGAALGIATTAATAEEWATGYVSTRDHFDCDGNALEEKDHYETNDVPCFDRGCVDDLLVHVHGWKNKDEGDAKGAFENAKTHLHEGGYEGEVIGWWWDSDCSWETSKDIAWWNGKKLARFVRDYRHLHGNDPTVRIMGHSLGVRVALTAAYYFEDAGVEWEAVRSMHLLGGAVPNDWPDHENLQPGLRDAFGGTYNYVNQEDDVLGWYAYNWAEWNDALGKHGSENGGTCNFHDWDVTDWWGNDHDFETYIEHCNDLVVEDMHRVDEYDEC